jgi:hypothetical protein
MGPFLGSVCYTRAWQLGFRSTAYARLSVISLLLGSDYISTDIQQKRQMTFPTHAPQNIWRLRVWHGYRTYIVHICPATGLRWAYKEMTSLHSQFSERTWIIKARPILLRWKSCMSSQPVGRAYIFSYATSVIAILVSLKHTHSKPLSLPLFHYRRRSGYDLTYHAFW